jgi:ABC-type transporter Mla subunit MlaD
MGDMLQADLDTLHRLGQTLSDHADAIDKIKVTQVITMPDSPVQPSAQISAAVMKAYGLIGANIRQLSDSTKTASKTYEETDQAFADQLRRYTSGT